MDLANMLRKRDETISLIRNYLEEHALTDTVQALDLEKAKKLPNVETFKSLLMGGEFGSAVAYFFQFQKESSTASCQIVYQIWRRSFWELLSVGNRNQAEITLYTHLYSTSRVATSLINDYRNLDEYLRSNRIPTLESPRDALVITVEDMIVQNEALKSIFYPTITEEQNRLQTLLEQSLNWQHRDCQHSTASASLLADHHCNPQLLYQNQNMTYQTLANNYTNLNASSSGGGEGFSADPMRDELISYQPPQQSPPVYLEQDSDLLACDDFLDIQPDVTALPSFSLPDNAVVMPPPFPLPKDVMKVLKISHITGIEFHPQLPLILVCTTSGEMRLYNLSGLKYPNRKEFKIWNPNALSQELQDLFLQKDRKTAGAVCVAWGSHGSNTNYAVGFSEGLVQTYNYAVDRPTGQHLEIEAHSGPVNDMVFYSSQGELKLVTCGDDKYIRAWNSSNGSIYWKLTHTAPLNSLALHQDGNTVQLFTSDVVGTAMKPNLGVQNGLPDDYPHFFPSGRNGRFELKFSSDGKRLFSFGVESSMEVPNVLVEVDRESFEHRRKYNWIINPQPKRMDICSNGYIAVGDERSIKVWHLNNGEEYFTRININNDKDFPDCPMVKFNREGTLLGVVSLNRLSILANDDGKNLLDEGVSNSGRFACF